MVPKPGQTGKFGINLTDEVIRGSVVTHDSAVIPPPAIQAPPKSAAKKTTANATATSSASKERKEMTPLQKTTTDVTTLTAGLGGVLALGKATAPAFMGSMLTAGLAGLIGYRAVWGVTPALHSPLMSVTNAISGLVGVGGMFVMGGGYLPGTIPQALGAGSVLLAFVNISGGFVITKRMLNMFRRA